MSMCLYCAGLGETSDGYHVHKCNYCKGTGCNQSAPFRPVDNGTISCSDCDGLGFIDEHCEACNGSGEGMAADTICGKCSGLGVEMTECETCGGSGEMEQESDE